MIKYILSFLGAVVIFGSIYGAYQYPKSQIVTQTFGSPTGTTFNTAKVAAINFALPQGITGTTSLSILNIDASDRAVTDGFAFCSGLSGASTSVSAIIFQAATTTTNAPVNLTNFNSVLGITAATSSVGDTYTATTTFTAIATGLRRWPAGTYLTFWDTATTTGTCNVGVHYLGL